MSVWLKQFQKYLSKEHCKHVVIDRENKEKRSSKIKWTEREYHVQDNAGVAQKYVKIYCDTNQFLALPFFVPHPKPYRARGLDKHYHLHFDPKLGYGI